MNNILLFESDKQGKDTYLIQAKERVDHLNKVLNKKAGDSIKVCLLNEGMGEGTLLEVTPQFFKLKVSSLKKTSSPHIKLLVAISRPPTIKKILEHGTSLGVKEFHFFVSKLTEKSFLEAKLFREGLFEKSLEYGLSQSKMLYELPKVFTYQQVPELEQFNCDQKYLLKMDAGPSLKEFPPDLKKPICLAIGPERGFTQQENELFEKNQFLPIEVSFSTLRVEIATFSALSQLFLFS